MADIISNEVLDDLEGRFLTFYIGDTVYGLELLHVIEIISIQTITRVPNLPGHIKGITNLRGKIVPIIDIRLKFNLEERAYDEKTCIIVVVMDDMNIGLIVDSVSEVATIDRNELSVPPQFGSINTAQYLQSISKVGDQVILNISCAKFFESNLTGAVFGG